MSLQDRITISQLTSSADVLNLVRAISRSRMKLPHTSESRNLVEEICKKLSQSVAQFNEPCGVAIVQTQRNELLVELVRMSCESSASYVPAMQSEDLALLEIERIAAFKLETLGTEGQLTHPKAIAAELRKIEEIVVRFRNDRQACDLLDAMTQATAWAQDKGNAWAGVAARRATPEADSVLEVKPICDQSKDLLDVQFAAIGREWMDFSYQVRLDHA